MTDEPDALAASIIARIAVPRKDLFKSAGWQYFDAYCDATAYLGEEDQDAVEAAFIAHPDYDSSILALCLGFGTSAQEFCADAELPMLIGGI